MKRPAEFDLLNRGRAVIALDLKAKDGVAIALEIAERADALIEGYRPGVMERLGLGPEVCLAKNPRMVYGRMTGWGQDGPLADAAGHDLISIPYKGPAEAATDLIAGRLTVMPDSLGAATRNIRAGRTKALAVLSSARTPLLPEVPTMLGLGYKDFEFNGWIGILAPAGTPEAIVQKAQPGDCQGRRRRRRESAVLQCGAGCSSDHAKGIFGNAGP